MIKRREKSNMLRRKLHRSKIRYEKNVLVGLKEEYCTQKIHTRNASR